MSTLKNYTHAIVSRIPLSFRSRGELDLELAKIQHENFVQLLRDLGLDVIELPADENCPNCVFIEDIAIVCNGIALLTRPEANRLAEVESVRAVLKKDLGLPLAEIADQNAKLDGGDVLFTGREFFVGISQFTNEAGAKAVASAFPEYPCVPIKVTEHHHLKKFVSMGSPDLIICSSCKDSQEIVKRIEREATFSYQTLTLDSEDSANVLYINGTLVHGESEILSDKLDIPRQSIDLSELSKFSSGLSSCCILLRRSKNIRSL